MNSQTDIDRILGIWLAEGPDRAPTESLRSALAEVRTARQRRVLRLARPGLQNAHQMAAIGVVAIVLAALVGLGLSIRVGLVRLPQPSAPPAQVVPTPTATVPPALTEAEGQVHREISGDGYRMLVPASWTQGGGGAEGDVRRFSVTDGGRSWLAIQIAVERQDGTLTLCVARCATFTDVDTLDELGMALHDGSVGRAPVESPYGPFTPPGPPLARGETLLGAEPARSERPDLRGFGWGSDSDFEHVYAVHDGRAVVISFGYRAVRLGKVPQEVVDHVLRSFRFVEPIDPESLGLDLYSNLESGYEVLLPAQWASEPTAHVRPGGRNATAFGSGRGAGTRGAPALTITVGETDGSIGLCFNCSATVTNLDELEELVASTPSFFTTGPPERHSELVLGGELARSESAGIGNNCLGCPNAYYHVFTIHHGRPVVLAFDYWTVRFESMVVTPGNEVPFTQQMLDAILQSFRFTDG